MPNSKEELFASSKELPSNLRNIAEVLPAVISASRDLQGTHVTTFGFTRLTTVAAYCLVAGESPKELYQKGSLQAVLSIWGWGLWLNDFFDKNQHQESDSSRFLTELGNAEIKKNGDQIPILGEANLIVGNLPDRIKETAGGAIKTMIQRGCPSGISSASFKNFTSPGNF